MTTGAATATSITIPTAAIHPSTDVHKHQRRASRLCHMRNKPRIVFAGPVPIGAALAGCICLFLMDTRTSVWIIAMAVMFFGVPLGMFSTATQAAVYIQAPPKRSAPLPVCNEPRNISVLSLPPGCSPSHDTHAAIKCTVLSPNSYVVAGRPGLGLDPRTAPVPIGAVHADALNRFARRPARRNLPDCRASQRHACGCRPQRGPLRAQKRTLVRSQTDRPRPLDYGQHVML
jgi:hypothetical protein